MTRRTLVIGLSVALGALGGASCSNNQDVVSNALNLNRPVDITFACYGVMRNTVGTVAASPQPLSSCDFRSAERADPTNTPEPVIPGQENLTSANIDTTQIPLTSYFGLILQSASGTIAVSNWTTAPASTFGGNASGVGEVTVLDADGLTPGKNAISVGDNPIALETDKTGCFVVTANAGSCDLSVLDVNTAAQAALAASGVGKNAQVIINRLNVMSPNGTPLYARPSAMVGEPSLALSHLGQSCPATLAPTGLAYIAYPNCNFVAGIDMSSGQQGTVTSLIQFDATGAANVVTDPNLINTAVAACPVECTDTSKGLTKLPPSGTAALTRPFTLAYEYDNPNPADPARPPSRQLVIGADNSSKITIAKLQNDPDDTKQMQPTSTVQVDLSHPAGTALGVTSVAMSAKIGMGGNAGDPLYPPSDDGTTGGFGQYVYAVATDATVRVIDVLGANNTPVGTPNECDTQIDPRAIEATTSVASNIPLLQCIPVGYTPTGAPTPLPRRKNARSAGIQLPGRAVPNSVAIVHPPNAYDPNNMLTRPGTGPTQLVGTFAIITSTAGPTYIANVDDDNNAAGADSFNPASPQLTEPSLNIAHQLRDGVSARDTDAQVTATVTNPDGSTSTSATPACDDLGTTLLGGPRASAEPATDASLGTVSASKLGELPSLRQIKCVASDVGATGIAVSELMLAADRTTRSLVFPDLKSLPLNENWTATWEGVLSLDSANAANTVLNGPSVRQGNFITKNVDGALLDDASNPFCYMGVQPYDIVQFLGCNPANNDLDCPANYKCYVHADTQVLIEGIAEGSCMLETEADRLATACRDYLISLRRYTVQKASTGELFIMPRLHELNDSPLDGCTDDNQCKALANAEVQLGLDQFDQTSVDTHQYTCMVDSRRAPLDNDPTKKRCVQTCIVGVGADRDTGCDTGSLCIGDAPGSPGVCMEGVIPPQACMNAPQRYEVRGHEAFIVIGDQTGYEHPIVGASVLSGKPAQIGDACVVNPNADPRQLSRIPLSAPACTATNLTTGEVTPGVLEPNPCSFTTDTTDTEITYTGGNCNTPTSALTTRTNVPAIRLRKNGMTLTMVDPVYPGDTACAQDRGGAAGVGGPYPLTFPGLNIKFQITDGSDPLTISNAGAAAFNPVLPVKVVAGPDGSIWVLDDGDFLSQTITQSSTLGSVFRIESLDLGIVNLLQ